MDQFCQLLKWLILCQVRDGKNFDFSASARLARIVAAAGKVSILGLSSILKCSMLCWMSYGESVGYI